MTAANGISKRCHCESITARVGGTGDLPCMIATLASYDRMFGPVHLQTLSVAALVGEALAESGESELARRLLERVVRDVVRAAGPAHRVRLAALASLRDLHVKSGELAAAIAAQNELTSCLTALAGPDSPQTVEAKSCLGSLLMRSESVAAA